jgi:hypothetical protein
MTSLSRRRMVWLQTHPLHPPCRQQVVSLSMCVADWALLTGDGAGGEVGEEPNHTTARKPSPLQIIQYSIHRTETEIFCKVFNPFPLLRKNKNIQFFLCLYCTIEHLNTCTTCVDTVILLLFVAKRSNLFSIFAYCLRNTIRMHRVVFVLHCLIVAGFSYL